MASTTKLHGLKDLIFDAVHETTSFVERTHRGVTERNVRRASAFPPLAESAEVVGALHGVASGAVYSTIRGVNQGVKALVDLGLSSVFESGTEGAQTSTAEGESPTVTPNALESGLNPFDLVNSEGAERWVDAAQAALNAIAGHFLRSRGNALDLKMTFRHAGKELIPQRHSLCRAYPDATPRIAVFVHGLGCSERVFKQRGGGNPSTDFGKLLRTDLGYTPVYVRYNTGVHISTNGEELARRLELLCDQWPVPVEELVFVGHSMGGLVARSAAHYGGLENRRWVPLLRHVFCIASPHLGAPLEKLGNFVGAVLSSFDTAGTQVTGQLLNARSAGIKDLRYGYTVHDEWAGRDADACLDDCRQNVPLLEHVAYYFIGSTITRSSEDPIGALVGDLLVRLPSACGEHPEPARRIAFRYGRVIGGVDHISLACHPAVYRQIRHWLEASLSVCESPS